MGTVKQTSDRRNCERFPLERGAFVTSDHPAVLSGSIVDISMGGLLYEYCPLNNFVPNRKKTSISIGSRKYQIDDIPSQTIDDFVDQFSFGSTRKRRIKFGTLAGSQAIILQYYIYENMQYPTVKQE